MGDVIEARRTTTNVPIKIDVTRDGGITGLTIAAKILDGGDTSQFLDHDDGEFKAAGHTTPTVNVPEVDSVEFPGLYAIDGGFDLSAINIPLGTDALHVHFEITAGGEAGIDVDIIQLVDSLTQSARGSSVDPTVLP